MGSRRVPWPPPLDVLSAVLLLAAAVAELVNAPSVEHRVALVLLAPLCTIPLLWRRVVPVGVLIVVMAGVSMLGFADPGGEWVSPFAALIVALYSAAAYTSRRRAILGLGLVLVFFASGTALDNLTDPGSRPIGDLLYMGVLSTAGWAVGRTVRRWREQAEALEQRTAELEQEREWRAKAAVVEERNRIARELHDVIAHSVSVMVVQAAAAEQMLSTDPPRAREPVVSIQQTGRQAVLELRRLLGILRPSEEEASLAPQPTLRSLNSLAERAREAGLTVEVRVEGAPRDLTPGVELTAYRLVQEALTNTLKHVGATTATVEVRYGNDRLAIEVIDAGGTTSQAAGGTGHGLLGMRERVALYGGVLQAGPCATGGYAVRAELPLSGAAP